MIEDTEITVLPEDGIISVKDLARMLDVGIDTLINGLSKQKVPYIKLTRFHRHWMIRLRDLKPYSANE